MDDFRACSELCEENGFPRQAALFRALADGGRKAYVVLERECQFSTLEPADSIPEWREPRTFFLGLDEKGTPRAIFLDRCRAEREAADRNVRRLRELRIRDLCNCPDELDAITDLGADELARQIGMALGREFNLGAWFHQDGGPSFPASATDEQMIAISNLFRGLDFFYVVELGLAPGDGLAGAGPPHETADGDNEWPRPHRRRRLGAWPHDETADDDIPF